LLPEKYSPINKVGSGNQKCYLAEISDQLVNLILFRIEHDNSFTIDEVGELARQWQTEHSVNQILKSGLNETEKEQLILARSGQGQFKKNLLTFESKCRFTGVSDPSYLIASHMKPWKVSDNNERLDGNNGLLLSPHVDKLFDKGWVSFSNQGDVLVHGKAIPILKAWRLDKIQNIGIFTQQQIRYLTYHRENVFRSINSRDLEEQMLQPQTEVVVQHSQ
jgi:predicted restriction endonuclease